ncbi:hypothetical protein AAC387_Pa06g1956 [Persea americana]
MDGGAASLASFQSDPSPLMDRFRTILSYAKYRNAKISIIKSILKKKQDHALPSEIPHDLILEAKVRFGKEKKFDSSIRSVPCPIVSAIPDETRPNQILQFEKGRPLAGAEVVDDTCHNQILQVEKGSMLDAAEIVGLQTISGSADESCQNQILHVKKALGRTLSNAEITGLHLHMTDGKGFELTNPKALLHKDGADPKREETWSSLFFKPSGACKGVKTSSTAIKGS